MTFIPIIKVVSVRCNLKCGYCFYHTQEQNNDYLMNDNVLEVLIKENCMHGSHRAQFIWHGGEPLLAGIDFFKKVIMFQNKYQKKNQKIINSIQTNGTLINEQWAKFFKDNHFGVGVSLDGPNNLHNYFRKFSDGTGSFDSTWKGIQILKQNNIQPGIIAVINSLNSQKPQKMFDFFVNTEFKTISFNHASGKNPCTGDLLESSVNPKDYAEFMKKTFDLWIKKDDSKVEIKQFRSILQAFLGGKYRSCEFDQGCERYFTINYNGNIYPCDCNAISNDFYFGNIKDGLAQVFTSKQYKRYLEQIQEIRKNCLDCQWYAICKGGCTRDYYLKISDNQKNHICKGLREIYQHISNKLESYSILKNLQEV